MTTQGVHDGAHSPLANPTIQLIHRNIQATTRVSNAYKITHDEVHSKGVGSEGRHNTNVTRNVIPCESCKTAIRAHLPNYTLSDDEGSIDSWETADTSSGELEEPCALPRST